MGRKGGKGSIDDVLKCSEQGFHKVTIQDGIINILTTDCTCSLAGLPNHVQCGITAKFGTL